MQKPLYFLRNFIILNRLIKSPIYFTFIIPIFISIGCAKVMMTEINHVPKSKTSKVIVFKRGDPATRPFIIQSIISVVDVRWQGRVTTIMKKNAASIGADALIEFVESNSRYTQMPYKWGSAFAVRFTDSAPLDSSFSKFSVAIPHSHLLTDRKFQKKSSLNDSLLRLISQEMLVRKGYYAFLVNDTVPQSIFENSLNPVPGNIKCGGLKANLVLGLRFINADKMNVVLMAGESNAIEAALYSKSVNQYIWKNIAEGSSFSFGIIPALASGRANKSASIYRALKNLSKTIPSASSVAK